MKVSQISSDHFALKHSGLVPAVVAMVVTALVHWPSTTFSLLLYDDSIYVSDNPYVSQGLMWESLQWAFTTGHFGNWHPLTWVSLQLDASVSGINANTFHTTNVLLHVATTGVLARVCARLADSSLVGCVAAILFGIHPMHVESVAWVSERKGLLSSFFLALSLFSYLLFVDRPGLKRGSAVFILFVMSLMSKPMGVTLPLLLPILHLIYPPSLQKTDAYSISSHWRIGRSANLVLFCSLLLASAFFSMIAYQMQSAANALAANDSLSIQDRLATVVVNYVRYLGYYFWPFGFSFSFPRDHHGENVVAVVSSTFVIGLMSYLAWRWRHSRPYFSFAVTWYLIAFLPVIGFLQVGNQVIAMRYSDWPLIGIHLLLARGVDLALRASQVRWQFKPTLILVFSVLVFLLGSRSRDEASYWASDYSLYRRAVDLSPQNATAQAMLGRHYMGVGEDDLAIRHLELSIAANSENAEALSNLALLQFNRGNHDAARELSNRSLRLQPGKLEPRLVQGMLLAAKGSYGEAEHVFQEVLQTYPSSYLAWFNLASVYRRQDRYRESLAHYQKSLDLNPGQWQTSYYIGDCLKSLGDFSGATTAYSNAIRHSAGSSEEAIRNFLRLRLVCGETANLESLLSRLERTSGPGKPLPERMMYLVALDSKQASDEIQTWAQSVSTSSQNDPFVYEALGDAYCFIGKLQAANDMWTEADSLWFLEARSSAKIFRQTRTMKIKRYAP